MTLTILLAALWGVAATIVAFLPMRLQYAPGLALMIAAPLLVVLLAVQVHWLVGLGALLGFVSMFRNPLRYFWRKWRGLPSDLPPDIQAQLPARYRSEAQS